jgi:hypothetical protein
MEHKWYCTQRKQLYYLFGVFSLFAFIDPFSVVQAMDLNCLIQHDARFIVSHNEANIKSY